MEAADKIADCSQVEAKARPGDLSGEQTKVLAKAVAADPAAEDRLLGVAKARRAEEAEGHAAGTSSSPRAATPRPGTTRSTGNGRCGTGPTPTGAFRLAAKLTPEAGATVLGALAPFEKAAFDRARNEKRHEPHEAYLADALVDLAAASLAGRDGGGSAPAKPKSREAVVHGAGRPPGAATRPRRTG